MVGVLIKVALLLGFLFPFYIFIALNINKSAPFALLTPKLYSFWKNDRSGQEKKCKEAKVRFSWCVFQLMQTFLKLIE